MIIARLIVTSLTIVLGVGAAHAADPDHTGSIKPNPAFAVLPPEMIGGSTSIALSEQSVTASEPKPKPLPPLKPLPTWDPHVCIGC